MELIITVVSERMTNFFAGCVESHMRELLEQGFEIAVVKDATAAAKIPEGDGYLAALYNFRFMANAVWTTDEVVKRLQ